MSELKFTAANSLAGYIWQVRQALLFLLDADFEQAVEIETQDDITIRTHDGKVHCAIQGKHSFSHEKLTSNSVELWKTIRVWLYLHNRKKITPKTPLYFCTTQSTDQNLNFLTLKTRNPSDISNLKNLLNTIAQQGGNKELTHAYADWLSQGESRRASLIKQILITNEQPRISDIDKEIEKRLRRAAFHPEALPFFRDKLLGWFDNLVSSRLNPKGCTVTYEELNAQLIEMHQMAVPHQLISTRSEDPHPSLSDERKLDPTYLRQLELIKLTEQELTTSIAMFYRGRAEVGDWLNARPNGVTLLRNYEKDLESKWKVLAGRALRTKPSDQSAMVECGRAIHDQCMDYHGTYGGSPPPVHVANGVYHSLANAPSANPQIGWHPEYKAHFTSSSEEE